MLEESWPKIIGRGASETARPQAGVDKNKAKETWHGLNFCLVVPSLREKRAAVQSVRKQSGRVASNSFENPVWRALAASLHRFATI